jgi:hypothetical protein
MEKEARILQISKEDEKNIIETGNIEQFLGIEELRDQVVAALAKRLKIEALKNGVRADNIEERTLEWANKQWDIAKTRFNNELRKWIEEYKKSQEKIA